MGKVGILKLENWDVGKMNNWKMTIGNGGFGELEMWGIPKLGTLGIWNQKQTWNVGN